MDFFLLCRATICYLIQSLDKILIFLAELEQSRPNKNLQVFLDNTLKLIASIKAWIDATRDALALFVAHEGETEPVREMEPVHETEPVAEAEEQIGRSCVRWCVVVACVTILGFLYI
jgi:hypothetical protein